MSNKSESISPEVIIKIVGVIFSTIFTVGVLLWINRDSCWQIQEYVPPFGLKFVCVLPESTQPESVQSRDEPSNISSGDCAVPDVVQWGEVTARNALYAQGFNIVRHVSYIEDFPENSVLAIDPAPNTIFPCSEHHTIAIYVNLGSTPTSPPPTPTLTPLPPTPKELNLVVNGDFMKPWTTGWYQHGNPSVLIENPKRNDEMWLKVTETSGDRWVSGACQDIDVVGIDGLKFEADVLLQVARFGNTFLFLTEEPWSMGAVTLFFYDYNEQLIGQAWFYATRRDDLNPAADQSGYNQGTVFTRRLDAFTDIKIQENLAELASNEIPYMDQNAVSKISICLVAASKKSQDHYPGDGWMTNVLLYPTIP